MSRQKNHYFKLEIIVLIFLNIVSQFNFIYMNLHTKINETQVDILDVPLRELFPEIEQITPEAIEQCYKPIPNYNSISIFQHGKTLRSLLFDYYSFFETISITKWNVDNICNRLKDIIEHLLQCDQSTKTKNWTPKYKVGLTYMSDKNHSFVKYNPIKKKPETLEHLFGIERGENEYGCCTNPLFKQIPETYDFSEYFPEIKSVRSQGPTCGSCWAFATTAVIEGALMKAKRYSEPLSVQDLLDFDDLSMGCDGSFLPYSFYYAYLNGLPSEENYPYKRRVSDNPQKVSERTDIYGFCYKNNGFSPELLKQIIYTFGPVYLTISASPVMYSYTDGIFDPDDCGDSGHAVVAVGYGPDYLILRNSWGRRWGQDGFFQMKIGVCDSLTEAVYVIA